MLNRSSNITPIFLVSLILLPLVAKIHLANVPHSPTLTNISHTKAPRRSEISTGLIRIFKRESKTLAGLYKAEFGFALQNYISKVSLFDENFE